MSDDPSFTALDRKFVSSQPHEKASFVDAILREFPGITRAEAEDAFEDGKEKIAPSNDREKLTEYVRERFRSGGW